MSAPPPRPNQIPLIAAIVRDNASRLNQEPSGVAAALFNGFRNASFEEADILSTLQFQQRPLLRLRHPQQSAPRGTTPIRHVGLVTRIAFAADLTAVFSCSDAGELIRWDIADGGIFFARHAHIGPITACAVLQSAGTDPRPLVLTAGSDRCARLWHGETGDLRAELTGHEAPVLCLAVSAAGDRALTGSADGTVRLWNLEHGTSMSVLQGHNAPVVSCAFVPNPTAGGPVEILSGAADGTVILWRDQFQVRSFKGHSANVTSLVVRPELDVIVTAADDCTVRVWKLSSGEQQQVMTGHVLGVSGCVVTDDTAPMIVSWSVDHTIRRWDLTSGNAVGDPMHHDAAVEGCAIVEPQHLFSWSADATLRLWDRLTGEEIARISERSPYVAADSQSWRCVAATAAGTLRIWSSEYLTLEQTLCSADVTSSLIRPPGVQPGSFWSATNVLIVKSGLSEIDVSTGEQQDLEVSNIAAGRELLGSPIAADGSRMLLWMNAELLCIKLTNRRLYFEWAHAATIDGAIVSDDGTRAVTWHGSTLSVWNMETGSDERTITGHTGRISACSFAGHERAWSASLDGSVRLWDLRTGEEIRRFEGHSGHLLGWYLTPDLAVSWSDDNGIRAWDLTREDAGPAPVDAAGLDAPARITAVTSRPTDTAASSRTLARIVMGTSDGRIIGFAPGQEPLDTRVHTHRVHDIVYVPGADAFATCSDDGTVRLWRNGAVVAGAVFYSPSPVVRLLPVGEVLVGLDENGRAFVLDASRELTDGDAVSGEAASQT